MAEISPTTQAALDAADEVFAHGGRVRDGFAAALRVIADQVVPPEQERLFNEERPWDVELCGVVDIRLQLLSIAAELQS